MVPTVCIQLVTGVKLLPQHSTKIQGQTQGDYKAFLVVPDFQITDLEFSIESKLLELKNE